MFCPHESVFSTSSRENQDLLWKIDIPMSLRREALEFLERVNINAFSLFGSEEALIEACATRQFVIKESS